MRHFASREEMIEEMRRIGKIGGPRRKGVKMDHPHPGIITREKLLKAIKGTGGIYSKIAHRLGCAPHSVRNAISRPGNEDIQKAFEEEKEKLLDEAETSVRHWIKQRDDPGVSSTTARWFLTSKGERRGFREKTTVRHEGGDTPVQLQQQNVVSIDSLQLPLAVRKLLLQRQTETSSTAVPQPEESAPSIRFRKKSQIKFRKSQ